MAAIEKDFLGGKEQTTNSDAHEGLPILGISMLGNSPYITGLSIGA